MTGPKRALRNVLYQRLEMLDLHATNSRYVLVAASSFSGAQMLAAWVRM